MPDLSASTRTEPFELAQETYVVQGSINGLGAPVTVHLNAMLIRGVEPVLVDCGAPIHRRSYLDDVFALVDPLDVKWVFISHEDSDHIGNLEVVMDMCPNAILLGSWFLANRLGVDPVDVPLDRWRWLNDGDVLDLPDRQLVIARPPVFDEPTSRGLLDLRTGVYWAGDAFGATIPAPCPELSAMSLDDWEAGFATFQLWNSPWLSMVDERRFGAACAALRSLGVRSIASAHGPAILEPWLDQAFRLLGELAARPQPEQPAQALLDQILAAVGRHTRAAGAESPRLEPAAIPT